MNPSKGHTPDLETTINNKKNEGSRHWGDWQAYFNRPLGINRSEGIY
jgi:hypothetical protein